MKKKSINLIIVILSILILLFFEEYTYKLFTLIKFNVNTFTPSIQLLINLLIKIVMCIIIYFIYKNDLKQRRRIKSNTLKNIIYIIVGTLLVLASSYLLNYVLNYLSNLLNINLINKTYYNVFVSKMDISLLCSILNNYIINPFLYCITIILGTDKLIKNKTYSTIISGLIAGILFSLTLKGPILFLILNSINIVITYIILSIIYNKTNNILLSVLIRIFYPIAIIILANYVGVFI